MSPDPTGSSVIQCFEGSDAIEIRNRITFDFYTGLPRMHIDNYVTHLKIFNNDYQLLHEIDCKEILRGWIIPSQSGMSIRVSSRYFEISSAV